MEGRCYTIFTHIIWCVGGWLVGCAAVLDSYSWHLESCGIGSPIAISQYMYWQLLYYFLLCKNGSKRCSVLHLKKLLSCFAVSILG